ncbi:hypothetical protein TNCV_4527541 [Trichonephila clavipes]|nr:hypothetical protein TNCV_4527541 [Trichonephila clavipes]
MKHLPSPKSRRRKTFKVSDAMETDANPSDTDYVTGLASEEDESFLEADFTQVADNPLKGPLSQSSLHEPNHSLLSLLATKYCYAPT